MKKFCFLISLGLAILLNLCLAKYATADGVWEDLTHGIRDAALNAVAIDPINPDVVYVGSSRSILKTVNGGRSWEEVFTGGGGPAAVNFITMDPESSGVIYAASQNGLYKSSDGGRHWKGLFSGIGPLERDALCIAIDPHDPNRVYAGTGSGLFWTTDGGGSWKKASGRFSDSAIRSIAIHPTKSSILYAGGDLGAFKTLNGGQSWERVFISSEETVGTRDLEDLDIDEAKASLRAVNWIEVDSSNLEIVYLGTKDGLFASVDAGLSWKKMSEQGLLSNEISCILVSPRDPNLLYSATKKGVFRFSKDVNSWDELYAGITARDIRSLALDRKGNWLWAATESGIFKIGSGENPSQNSPIAQMSPEEILAHFAHEPTVNEIQEAAIRYAEVHPEKIATWRKGAKKKAWLPKFSIGVDDQRSDTYEIYTSGSTSYYIMGPDDRTYGWDASITWDLGDLIWNPSQTSIDVRSKLMVQLRDDILDEVTRLYFERRRLQVEMLLEPPEGLKIKLEKELRLRELTADIDALTGGYLSRRLGKG